MSGMTYCPQCWPADEGMYDTDRRCERCGSSVLIATPEKAVELLIEQNFALAEALHEAITEIRQLTEAPEPPKPYLRLVKGARKPSH